MNFYFVPNENARFRREDSYCFLARVHRQPFSPKSRIGHFSKFSRGTKIDAVMNSTYSNFYITYSLKQNLKQ